jgi:hypothetical protein
MPRVFVFLAISFLACPAFSWAQEDKKAAKPETTYVKLEMRGVLRITGKSPDVKMAAPGGNASLLRYMSESTKVPIDTRIQIAAGKTSLVVDFGEDKKLHELAEKLNGTTVVLSGELQHFTYMQQQRMIWAGGTSSDLGNMPVTMMVIRVTSMNAAKPQ